MSEDASRYERSDVQVVLQGLLRSLEQVKTQRLASLDGPTNAAQYQRTRGQIDGLNIAIAAVKRRIR